MFRVIYADHLKGTLECHFCGRSFELTGNVKTYQDDEGVTRTYPDARLRIAAHFRKDSNVHIPVCDGKAIIGATPWVAVDKIGNTVAKGRVVVDIIENVVQYPQVIQDDPARQ